MVFLAFWGSAAFGESGKQEELAFLLFSPNSSSQFEDPAQAKIHLDAVAQYIKDKEIIPRQIYVYGYTADVNNGIDPVQLSINRALFVIQELQKRGIPGDLFADPVGHGPVDLWGDNTNESDRRPNRRARILVENVLLTLDMVTGTATEEKPFKDQPEKPLQKKPEKPAKKPPKEPSEQWHFPKLQLPQVHLPFPWWLLLLVLPVIAAVMLLAKRIKDAPAKPKQPKPEKPAPAPKPEPVFAQKPEPVFEQKPEPPPVARQSFQPEPAPVFEKAKPLPFFAKKAEPPKEKIKVLGEEEIRRHAYVQYERRNGQNGDAAGDWFYSICELTAKYQALGFRVILYWEPEAQTAG